MLAIPMISDHPLEVNPFPSVGVERKEENLGSQQRINIRRWSTMSTRCKQCKRKQKVVDCKKLYFVVLGFFKSVTRESVSYLLILVGMNTV